MFHFITSAFYNLFTFSLSLYPLNLEFHLLEMIPCLVQLYQILVFPRYRVLFLNDLTRDTPSNLLSLIWTIKKINFKFVCLFRQFLIPGLFLFPIFLQTITYLKLWAWWEDTDQTANRFKFFFFNELLQRVGEGIWTLILDIKRNQSMQSSHKALGVSCCNWSN